MSYVRPDPQEATLSWNGETEYIRPLYTAADLGWALQEYLEAEVSEGISLSTTVEFPDRFLTEDTVFGDIVSAINTRLAILEFITDTFIHYDWPARATAFNSTSAEEFYFYEDTYTTLNGLTIHGVTTNESIYVSYSLLFYVVKEAIALDQLDLDLVLEVLQKYHGAAIDTVAVTEEWKTKGILNRTVIQNLSIRDRMFLSWFALAVEGIDIDVDEESLVTKLSSLLERIAIQEGTAAVGEFTASIVQALTMMSVVQGAKGAVAFDEAELSVTIIDRAHYYSTLLEQAQLLAIPSMTGTMRVALTDRFTQADTVSLQGMFNALINEGLSFQLSFNTGDATYTGWVMNTKSFAVSEYDNYPFNSFASHDGVTYGTNENGLYRLDGEDDAGVPIQARARLGLTNFNKSVLKRLDSVYLGLRADGMMVLKIETEGGVQRFYQLEGVNDMLHRRRVHPLAKGHKAVWWQFELANVNGADFEISEIEFVLVMLSRSV